MLDEKELNEIQINIDGSSLGEAPGLDEGILQKHRDMIDLDYWRIGYLAETMLTKLSEQENRKFLTKSQIIKLLTEYRDKKKIDVTKMKETLLKSLNWIQ